MEEDHTYGNCHYLKGEQPMAIDHESSAVALARAHAEAAYPCSA
jgi:hypothetical protein